MDGKWTLTVVSSVSVMNRHTVLEWCYVRSFKYPFNSDLQRLVCCLGRNLSRIGSKQHCNGWSLSKSANFTYASYCRFTKWASAVDAIRKLDILALHIRGREATHRSTDTHEITRRPRRPAALDSSFTNHKETNDFASRPIILRFNSPNLGADTATPL